MHRDRVPRRHPVQDEPGPPRGLHKVFADDFEPGHLGLVLENVRVVRRPKTDAHAQVREAEAVRHESRLSVAAALTLARVLTLAGVRVGLAAALTLARV